MVQEQESLHLMDGLVEKDYCCCTLRISSKISQKQGIDQLQFLESLYFSEMPLEGRKKTIFWKCSKKEPQWSCIL
jgi:hypothetical protein